MRNVPCAYALRCSVMTALCLFAVACAGPPESANGRANASAGSSRAVDGDTAFAAEDYQTARRLWAAAAARGDAAAMFGLGLLLDRGLGSEADPGAAATWYALAVEQGHSEAAVALAVLYDFGRGMVRDVGRAAELYRQAANHGSAQAQSALARMYESGEGVERDLGMARALFERAARQGYGPAQNSLGIAYFHGSGAVRDVERAFFWLELATRNGLITSRQNRDFVAAQISPQRRLVLVGEADSWRPNAVQ